MEQSFLESALKFTAAGDPRTRIVLDNFDPSKPETVRNYLDVAIRAVALYAASMPSNENAQKLSIKLLKEFSDELQHESITPSTINFNN